MNKYYKKFGIRLLGLVLILTAIAVLFFGVLSPESYFNLFPIQMLLLIAMTTVSHLRLSALKDASISRYFSTFVQLMGIKLFIYIVFLALTMHYNRDHTVEMGVSFMLLYLVFTVFEIAQLQNLMRSSGESVKIERKLK